MGVFIMRDDQIFITKTNICVTINAFPFLEHENLELSGTLNNRSLRQI